MSDCHEIEILLATRRDLSAAQEREVRAHLSRCATCAIAWRREERTTAALRVLPMSNGRPPERVATAVHAILAGKAPRRRWQRAGVWHIRHGVGVVFGVSISMLIIVSFAVLFGQSGSDERINAVLAAPTSIPPTARSFVQVILPTPLPPNPTMSLPVVSPTPQTALATTPTAVQHGTLYVTSYLIGPNHDITGSRVTAVDLATQIERYAIDNADDAILSPDRTRLYYTSFEKDQDYLFAAEAQTGRAIWRVAIKNRMGYKGGGPSVLAVSPDGRWLYIHSYDANGNYTNAQAEMLYWLQIIDTKTGTVLPATIPISKGTYCSGPTLITPPVGEELYLACSDVLVLNSQKQRITQKIPVTGAGAVISPDGRWLYVVSSNLHIDVVDLQKHAVAQKLDQNSTNYYANVFDGLVALSADGNTLVTGQILEEKPGTDTATTFRVFDTRTWQKIADFRFERPVVQYALTVSADGSTIYIVARSRPDGPADTIVELDSLSGQVRAEHARPGEDIMRIFITP
jgi:hypothetical protein